MVSRALILQKILNFPVVTEATVTYGISLILSNTNFVCEVLCKKIPTYAIKEYPNFKGFVYKTEGDWSVIEETTGKGMGIGEKTMKGAMEALKDKLNSFRIGNDLTVLKSVGIFTQQQMKDKLGFKKGECK